MIFKFGNQHMELEHPEGKGLGGKASIHTIFILVTAWKTIGRTSSTWAQQSLQIEDLGFLD